MKTLRGQPLVHGYGAGTAVLYTSRSRLLAPEYAIAPSDVVAEHGRLDRALAEAATDLARLREQTVAELGQSLGAVFATHEQFLHDPELVGRVRRRVEHDLVNVEKALLECVTEIADRFGRSEAAFLRDRAADVQDVGRRLIGHLTQRPRDSLTELPPRSVLVADELLPSDTFHLDRDHLEGIAMVHGGQTSHAAILARSLGIPAVTGVSDLFEKVTPGQFLLIDGEAGVVIVDPAEELRQQFARSREQYRQQLSEAVPPEEVACRTRDGVEIKLYGNIGRVEDADQVVRQALHGVGLFRTEYLYLDADDPPDIERQRQQYAVAAQRLQGRCLTIRTLDPAGDKIPTFLAHRCGRDSSSGMGMRGLRFSLIEGTLLRTQVAAILDVAQNHPVQILLPMVLGEDELAEAIDLVRTIASERGCEHLPPIGAMIETPAAVFVASRIAQRADFVSLGTNDLVQFILATDRNVAHLVETLSVVHPSVLRAIDQTVRQCQAADCPVSVCGEAAGHPWSAALLVGLGIDRLSMIPAQAPRIRRTLRLLARPELNELAESAARKASLDQVCRLIRTCPPLAEQDGAPDRTDPIYV